LHLVLLEPHPRAAAVAGPPPLQRRRHVTAGDPHPRRDAVTDRHERPPVRLASGQPPKHAAYPTVSQTGRLPKKVPVRPATTDDYPERPRGVCPPPPSRCGQVTTSRTCSEAKRAPGAAVARRPGGGAAVVPGLGDGRGGGGGNPG